MIIMTTANLILIASIVVVVCLFTDVEVWRCCLAKEIERECLKKEKWREVFGSE